MKRIIRPQFVQRVKEPRFFALRLDREDWAYQEGYRFEVLLLDEQGGIGGLVLLNETEASTPPAEAELPVAVMKFATNQQEGSGDFVDTRGDKEMQNRDKQVPPPHPREV